jgi:hypothetical protein
MPLEAEFNKHLHSLMVEVYEQTYRESEMHKHELVYRAQQIRFKRALLDGEDRRCHCAPSCVIAREDCLNRSHRTSQKY